MFQWKQSRYLAIIILILFLGVNVFAWGNGSIWVNLLMIFTLCLGLIGIVAVLPPLVMLLFVIKIYLSETGHEYQYTFSPPTDSLPAKNYQLQNEVKDLGFAFLGTYNAQHQHDESQNYRAWVFLDESKSISAAIIESSDGKHSIEFCSHFSDKFTLSTFYNMELEVDSELVMARYFMNSVENAFAFHSSPLSRLAGIHGKAVTYESVAETIESPELKLELHRSLGRAMMKKLSLHALAYLAYPLLGLFAYLLIPLIGGHFAAWIFFPSICILLWFFSPENGMEIFKSVEARKPRKAME